MSEPQKAHSTGEFVIVACFIQSAFISSTASQAGVASAAGEKAKDNQYLDIGNKTGGDYSYFKN